MTFPPDTDTWPDSQNNLTITVLLVGFICSSIICTSFKFRGRKNMVLLSFCICCICNLQMSMFLGVNYDRFWWFYGMMLGMRFLQGVCMGLCISSGQSIVTMLYQDRNSD
mmetsp:Transcript_38553/g.28418  ORF Transcript_38553/g.28418 Transcript_38553/m.28418 type:complete len:110 (+) Transcript_38553:237-566(+)